MTSAKLGYVILWVDDVDKALGFYVGTLGFVQKMRSGAYVELETGATTLALVARDFVRDDLHLPVPPAAQPVAEIALVVPRDEVAEAFERALRGGATEVQRPHEQPWGQIVSYFRDADGHLFEICSPVG